MIKKGLCSSSSASSLIVGLLSNHQRCCCCCSMAAANSSSSLVRTSYRDAFELDNCNGFQSFGLKFKPFSTTVCVKSCGDKINENGNDKFLVKGRRKARAFSQLIGGDSGKKSNGIVDQVFDKSRGCHTLGFPDPLPNKLVVAVDVDEVLGNFVSALNRFIADRYSSNHSVSEYHVYEFFKGCDGSILLDDTSSFTGEKRAAPNVNSARGFEVVDSIKSAVENVCPGVVSCADILALTARDSVKILGGPNWDVKLGRRDARTASQGAANNSIPAPTANLNTLNSRFNALGLSTQDLVALSGAHTIGQARCTTFRGRIYNENNLDGSFAQTTQSNCPSTNGTGDDNLTPLDLQSPTSFDNNYFSNLVNKKGLLHSDQELFNGGSTDSIVSTYSSNPSKFASDFAAAMIRMGDISPLTGSNGEIRMNCRMIN